MARRKLTEEELERIANKEWKRTPIFTSDEKVAYKAKNLTGPKTVEGKKRALENLRVGGNPKEGISIRHGGYVRRILDEDEQEYYFARREDYLSDYDINSSADEIILHQVLMDEVILMRLHKKQAEKPSADLSRPIDDCVRRINKGLESLGALRKQRLKQDEKVSTINIATIAQQFARELSQGALSEEIERARREEEEFLKKKKIIDVDDYEEEVIDDDNRE